MFGMGPHLSAGTWEVQVRREAAAGGRGGEICSWN